MPVKANIHKTINIFISLIWLINGLICKVLNFVPRHEKIVARILGNEYAPFFTKAIGIAEILMAVWILIAIKPRFCAIVQMIIVAMMNAIEFILVPDLLLWGKFNAVFAVIFILLIYYNEFLLNKKHHLYN